MLHKTPSFPPPFPLIPRDHELPILLIMCRISAPSIVASHKVWHGIGIVLGSRYRYRHRDRDRCEDVVKTEHLPQHLNASTHARYVSRGGLSLVDQ